MSGAMIDQGSQALHFTGLSNFLLTTALALTSAPAMAQNVGDWVLSPWQGSSVLYPGVVVARSGSSVTIQFDDGDVETRMAHTVQPYDWRKGSKIACQWSDGEWYRATITAMGSDGYALQIRYDDDGALENTSTSRCRTR